MTRHLLDTAVKLPTPRKPDLRTLSPNQLLPSTSALDDRGQRRAGGHGASRAWEAGVANQCVLPDHEGALSEDLHSQLGA